MGFLDWATVRARALLGTTAVLITLLSGGCSKPVEDSSKQCGAMPCRSNGVPYVTEKGAIVIYPGEQFAVAFTIENNTIVAASPKPADGQIANTIELKFVRDGGGMLLTLQNNLSGAVKYDAMMKAPDNRMVYTSSCTVDAGLQNFESWPHEIKFLALSNFRFQNEHVCR